MIYKGYVLEHSEVYDSKLGWHHFGVIKNVEAKDFTCIGMTLNALETNFHNLVDTFFDELQSLTDVLSVDITEDMIDMLEEVYKSKNMTIEEFLTVIAIDSLGELKQ